jgi:hypothetical protein
MEDILRRHRQRQHSIAHSRPQPRG